MEAGRFEPRNPRLQARSLTPSPGGIAGQYSKNVTIYKKLAASGFRFHVFERAMVSCFVLHVPVVESTIQMESTLWPIQLALVTCFMF